MDKVFCYDINRERLQSLKKLYKIRTAESNEDCVEDADMIILAVKPQNTRTVAESIKQPISGALLSILAGVTMGTLRDNFKTDKIIRTMPNTPAMVLEGITVWTASPQTPVDVKDKARVLLESFGEEVEVSDESYLDMATAVSGSGPAYVFLTMEAMIDASVHLGFPRDVAIKLVTATIRGSAVYSQQSEEALTLLRNNVTSPGGTTASALYELERGGFRTVISGSSSLLIFHPLSIFTHVRIDRWCLCRRSLGGLQEGSGAGWQRPECGPGQEQVPNQEVVPVL